MAAAVALRRDYDAKRLRALAKRSHDSDQTRRLLALAEIYDGGSRGDAAKLGGVGLQTIRDWVLRFNANGPAGLLNDKAPAKRRCSPRTSAVRWRSVSRVARFQQCTASFAG